MPTPSIEDYLDASTSWWRKRATPRVSDIASSLDVQPSSVTRMLQRLDEREFLVYEKYRGLVLTEKGQELGRRIKERHQLLEDFLRLLGVDEEDVQRDVEGIEHHVSPGTLGRHRAAGAVSAVPGRLAPSLCGVPGRPPARGRRRLTPGGDARRRPPPQRGHAAHAVCAGN